MLTIPNIVLLNDIIRLPKEILQEVSADLGLDTEGTIPELAENIWDAINSDSGMQCTAFGPRSHKILCGKKISVTWYRLFGGGSLVGIKNTIISNCGFDPFEKVNIPPVGELSSTPVLVSAALGENSNEYYLRYIYKSGVSKYFYGTSFELRPNYDVKTVYINEATGCIEVRTDSKSSGKFATSLARLTKQEISTEQVNIMAPFGNNIEQIADALQGKLIDTIAKPELLLEDFTQEQGNAIVGILAGLDAYFELGDSDIIQEKLAAAKAIFDTDFVPIPFTALILNGLEKVGMGVTDRDLRGLPLYDFLKPHLQHQGGFVQFQFPEDGVMQNHTIRVGLQANSVYFMTPATEHVIAYVRDRLIRRQ